MSCKNYKAKDFANSLTSAPKQDYCRVFISDDLMITLAASCLFFILKIT